MLILMTFLLRIFMKFQKFQRNIETVYNCWSKSGEANRVSGYIDVWSQLCLVDNRFLTLKNDQRDHSTAIIFKRSPS